MNYVPTSSASEIISQTTAASLSQPEGASATTAPSCKAEGLYGSRHEFKGLPDFASITSVTPSCTYNIFRLWFGNDGIKCPMSWANLLQDKTLNPGSNVYFSIDSRDHSSVDNKCIKELAKYIGINILDIYELANGVNCSDSPINVELAKSIKKRKDDAKIKFTYQKNLVQTSLATKVPYFVWFDTDARLLRPIQAIVDRRESEYNKRTDDCVLNRPFPKIIVRMADRRPLLSVYQRTGDMRLDAFINGKDVLLPFEGERSLYNCIFPEALHVDYVNDKKSAFNCFDNDKDIFVVPMNLDYSDKELYYCRYLSIKDKDIYKKQKETVCTYLN